MPRISEEGKLRQNRGTGTGADYLPWIKAREFNSKGTASTFADYKHGREIQVLSQGELYYYYLLRWQDDVVDIREQYPLVLELTTAICKREGIRHPNNGKTRMTTDFLVTKSDNTLEAYSIKNSKKDLENTRTLEKIYIEKLYWESFNVKFFIKYKEDVNFTLFQNIRDIVSCYDIKNVHNDFDVIRYKLAHK